MATPSILRAEARAYPTPESLWRDAILDQLADAACAIRDMYPSYAKECTERALAMMAQTHEPPSKILDMLK